MEKITEFAEKIFPNSRDYTKEEREIYHKFIENFFDQVDLDPEIDQFVSDHFLELI